MMKVKEIQKFFHREQLRLEVYRQLAGSYHVPDESAFDNLSVLAACLEALDSAAAAHLTKMLAEISAKKDIDFLAVDYARLFVGPYTLQAPPYGSVYLEDERRVMGASTADVQKRYRAAGLEVSADFKDAPDHIAAELEFMHYLIFKAMEAISRPNGSRAVAYLEQQQSFLENHLGCWGPVLAANMVANAETAFYRNLGRATAAYLQEDGQTVAALLAAEGVEGLPAC